MYRQLSQQVAHSFPPLPRHARHWNDHSGYLLSCLLSRDTDGISVRFGPPPGGSGGGTESGTNLRGLICALTAAFDTEPLGTNFDHFARNLIPRSPHGAKSSCPADTPDPRPRGAPAIKTCFCCSLQKRGRGAGPDQCCVSPLSVRARLAIPTIHHPPPTPHRRRSLPRPVSNFSCALCVVLGID